MDASKRRAPWTTQETKKPAEAGFSDPSGLGKGEAAGYFRVPITSISTRRFFARPSFVLLLATGCFSPLPSV